MSTKKQGALHLYKSYVFRDKDPVIDKLRTAVADSGLSYTKISEASSVSTTTMHNWFHGKTRRPQFCTVAAVLGAVGKQFVIADRRHVATSKSKVGLKVVKK